MKLSPFLWGALVVLGALVLYGHWRDTRQAEAVKVYQHTLDSLNLAIGISDAESVQLAAEAARWERIVDSLVKASPALPHGPAPIAPAHAPNGTSSDSVTYWKARADTLEAANRTLIENTRTLSEYARNRDAQIQALGHLLSLSKSSDSLHTAQRDSALAIANRAPVTHKRGFAVFGLRLCPVIGPSYSVIPGVGQGFGGSVTQPLSCGA